MMAPTATTYAMPWHQVSNMSEGDNRRKSAKALSKELARHCQSESLSKDGLREIIERYGHQTCHNEKVNDEIIRYLLKYFPAAASALVERCPGALRHADDNSFMPVHLACGSIPPEFCRLLVEAYPGSEQIIDAIGMLPLHCACANNTVVTVEYLYKLYPDAIHHTTTYGRYPIHVAIICMNLRSKPAAAVDIVQFLLDCDANVKLQKARGTLTLLHYACREEYNDSNIEAALQVIKMIYDAHPEAIENNEIASNIYRYHQQVQTFINSQLVYSRQAKDHRLMMTPNERGQLRLHTALQNNVMLGSIKLLVKGNPSAMRTPDHSGALPLHLACQHHESASAVQYLLDLDATTLDTVDKEGNSALHYACRGAKYDTIALLLEKYDAVSVSTRNDHKKLPIDLLFESNEVLDRESVEYTGSIFRLLRAYPETVMNSIVNMNQEARLDGCSTQNAKKGKVG